MKNISLKLIVMFAIILIAASGFRFKSKMRSKLQDWPEDPEIYTACWCVLNQEDGCCIHIRGCNPLHPEYSAPFPSDCGYWDQVFNMQVAPPNGSCPETY